MCEWLSCVQLFGNPWTVAHQVPLSMGFSRQEQWTGRHSLLQGIFPTQESNPGLPHCRQILYQVEEKSPISQRNSSAPGLPGATLLPSAPVPPTRPIPTWAALTRHPSPLKPQHAHRLRDMSLDAQFSRAWALVTWLDGGDSHLCRKTPSPPR